MSADCPVLASLSSAFPFEVAVGMNGVVWVNSGSVKHTIVISNAITAAEFQPDSAVPAIVRRLLEFAQ
jgi:exosome complex component RRP40